MLSLNGILGSIKDIKGEEDLRSKIINMLRDFIKTTDTLEEDQINQLLEQFPEAASAAIHEPEEKYFLLINSSYDTEKDAPSEPTALGTSSAKHHCPASAFNGCNLL